MKWNGLTMKERSDLMSLFLKAGVGSLSDMKRIYEEYQPLEGTAPYKYPDGGNVYNVRDLYNKYRTQYNLGKKAPSKPDITLEEYQHIIEALKRKIYYKK